MFEKLATFAYSNRRRVLFVAVIGTAIAAVFGAGVSKHLSPYGVDDPATQSVQAKNRFQAATGRQIDPGVIALISSGDVRRVARHRVESVAAELGAQPDVASVRSFYTTHDPAMVARNGRSTYVVAYFKARSDLQISNDAKLIESRFSSQRDVKLGGDAIANAQVNTQVGNDLGHAELLAFPFIFLLSLIFFRSVVASLLPPLLGGLAIIGTFFLLRLISTFTDLNVFALNLTTGLGLGLAIDYSLFIVSRYREEATRDGFGLQALRRTLRTAGRTVLFSSVTVAFSVAALTIFPQQFLYSMGIAGAIVALLAATLALTVLPALLAVLGPRVNALSPRRLRHAAERDARPTRSGAWYRLSQFITRRPAQVAVASAALLIALGIPFFTQIRFITADARVLPQSASAHQVQNALDAQFPPNRTTPLEVVVGASASSSAVRSLSERIAGLSDVSAVGPAQPASRGTSLLQVAPVHGPLTESTEQLVRDVRAIHTPYYLGVAGETASYLDLEHSLGAHLPEALAIVIAATLIVLFLMTGSVVLPLKAIVMNALNLSAVFGILVLIFQHGNLQGLLGYHSVGALDATQPILLFAIGFGLATDYGVFLLARIKEAHDAGAPNSEAVALGLERTGRIVTSAALLFAVAVGAFATSQIVFIKELGIGTALAVLLDASIVRALLVPSLMELLGSANWWAPRPLRRLYERIGLRETAPQAA